ncbi:MAG: hypothetical protein MRZ73_13385 [Pseudoflavonifractor capillosus]|nr:hypothetical protein [Pseudoflavonifractor capillosus]MDY4661467.1 hypothetical protein [Pseudoflavonifractor capillosus]
MKIREVTDRKKEYLALLLLADEQEDMVDRYLERGTMYVLEDGGVKAECVVTDEGSGILELKNRCLAYSLLGHDKAHILLQRGGSSLLWRRPSLDGADTHCHHYCQDAGRYAGLLLLYRNSGCVPG